MTSIEERVSKGIEFLDTNCPGWRDKIDLDSLDVKKIACCPLGQVFESYVFATNKLELSSEDEEKLGFEVSFTETPALNDRKGWTEFHLNVNKEYAILTEEWKRQILGSNL